MSFKRGAKPPAALLAFTIITAVLLSCCSLWTADPLDTPESNFETFWQEYNLCYALFEEKGVDWQKMYDDYRPGITPQTTDRELFDTFVSMLTPLNDSHVYLSSPFDFYRSGKGYHIVKTFSIENVKNNYLTEPKTSVSEHYTYGYLEPGIGYIHIDKMQEAVGIESHEQWVEEINPILQEFKNTKGVVIDVRNNGGGLVLNSRYIASRFCEQRQTYGYSLTKNGPGPDDYSQKTELYFNGGTDIYSGPVVLLTNNQTASAAEEFTLAMNTIPTVTHMGSPTKGVFSISLGRCLPNGWRYTVSPQKVIDVYGGSPEGIGVYPAPENLIYNTIEEKNAGIDRQLEAAVSHLR